MPIQLEQDSISPRLLQAIEMASELPKDEQDELAQFILKEIAELQTAKTRTASYS